MYWLESSMWLAGWLVGWFVGWHCHVHHTLHHGTFACLRCLCVSLHARMYMCLSVSANVCVRVVSRIVLCRCVSAWLVGWLVRLVELLLNWCFLVARALYRFNGLPIVYILIHSKQHAHTCTRLDSNRKIKRRARDGKETDVYLYIYGHSRAPRARDLSTIFQHFRAIICFLICDII